MKNKNIFKLRMFHRHGILCFYFLEFHILVYYIKSIGILNEIMTFGFCRVCVKLLWSWGALLLLLITLLPQIPRQWFHWGSSLPRAAASCSTLAMR